METEISSYGESPLKDVMRLRRMSMVTTDIVLNVFRIPAEYIGKEKEEKKKESLLDTYKVGQFVYLKCEDSGDKFLAHITNEYSDRYVCKLLENAKIRGTTIANGVFLDKAKTGIIISHLDCLSHLTNLMEPWIPEINEVVWVPEYKQKGLFLETCKEDVGFEYQTNIEYQGMSGMFAFSLEDIEPYYGQDLLKENKGEDFSDFKYQEGDRVIIDKCCGENLAQKCIVTIDALKVDKMLLNGGYIYTSYFATPNKDMIVSKTDSLFDKKESWRFVESDIVCKLEFSEEDVVYWNETPDNTFIIDGVDLERGCYNLFNSSDDSDWFTYTMFKTAHKEMSLLKEKEGSIPVNSLDCLTKTRHITPADCAAYKKEQEKRDKTLKEKRKEKNGSIEPQQKSIFSDYPQWSGHAVGEFDMEKFQKSGRIL